MRSAGAEGGWLKQKVYYLGLDSDNIPKISHRYQI